MNNLNFEQIGKRLKEIRISKCITQEYVAGIADVNVSHISNIENNRVKVSLSTLVHICNALNITVDYILAEEYKYTSDVIDKEILRELQDCNIDMKKRILKIIQILK